MKGMILSAGLAAATIGGASVLLPSFGFRSHCSPSQNAVDPVSEPQAVNVTADPACTSCQACRPTHQVFEVADLKAGFAESRGEIAVSFDEPPLAKPVSSVTLAKYEVTLVREELPMPRRED